MRLSPFLPVWELFTIDSCVLMIIAEGYRLDFLSLPPSHHLVHTQPALPLLEKVQTLLDKEAIERVPLDEMGRFYSRYFLVLKKYAGLRPIMDLRTLKKFLKTEKFCMTTL